MDVTVFECRKSLGGRACSFRDSGTGLLIDNSQHILLGCCERAIEFLSRIGSLDRVEFCDRITFVSGSGERLEIGSSFLPAPLHLLPSLARSGYLPARDKIGLAAMLARAAFAKPGKRATALEYLKSISGSEVAIARVVEPILVSALNERMDTASAAYARMVLLKSLVETKRGYRLGIPTVPLSELVAAPAAHYLLAAGCELRTTAPISRVCLDDRQVHCIETASGERLQFDRYVFAVPPWSLADMGVDPRGGQDLIWRSIVSAHIFFEGDAPPFDRACVVDAPFQWVFNKSRDFGRRQTYIQVVASACEGIVKRSNRELTDLAMAAAARAEPQLRHMRPGRALIFRAKRATFSTAGACDAIRPPSKTPLANLFLAGDWTDTRWPSTIEGAVRSGYAAAESVIESA